MYLSNNALLFLLTSSAQFSLKEVTMSGATVTLVRELTVATACSSRDLVQMANTDVVVGCENTYVYARIYNLDLSTLKYSDLRLNSESYAQVPFIFRSESNSLRPQLALRCFGTKWHLQTNCTCKFTAPPELSVALATSL